MKISENYYVFVVLKGGRNGESFIVLPDKNL